MCVAIRRITALKGLHCRGELFTKYLENLFQNDNPPGRRAPLPRKTEDRARKIRRGLSDIRILRNQCRVVSAQFRLQRKTFQAAPDGDFPACFFRTGKGHRGQIRAVEQVPGCC